jgi:hypothetical protein
MNMLKRRRAKAAKVATVRPAGHMVYWERVDRAAARTPGIGGGVLGGGGPAGFMERYGLRRITRMGLYALGLPAALVFPLSILMIPIIRGLVQEQMQAQVQAEIQKRLDEYERKRKDWLHEAYRGIIAE